MKPLIRFVAKARRLTREEFLAEQTLHVLVVEPFVLLEDTGFQTMVGADIRAGTPMVVGLAKRGGANAFDSMITVGRASNNDIELKSPAVSKFHSYLQPQGDGFVLVDGNSTFGTVVGGRRLEPRTEKWALESGARIAFGELQTTYYTPDGFFDFLKRELEETGGTSPDQP